jgi:large subunit ribosomal protein L4
MNKTTKTQKKTVAASADVLTLKDLDLTTEHKRSISPRGFSIWVRSLLQNWRQGTVGCKGRSDVNKSNKKPWKQKGTGRARAGSARSPLWRGGGVIFGPQARVRKLSVTKKMKQGVMNSLLFNTIDQGRIRSLDWEITGNAPKTSLAYQALKGAGLHDKKVALLLAPHDVAAFGSFANIPNLRILFFDQVNAFDLTQSDVWVFLKKDQDQFKEMASQWI